MADFAEIERDYKDFCEYFRQTQRIVNIKKSLRDVLLVLNQYINTSRLSMREIFGRTSIDSDDRISKYEFAEKMNELAAKVNDSFDAPTIERLARELNRGDNLISYSRLIEVYEQVLNVKVEDLRYDSLRQKHAERICWHIADFVNSELIELEKILQTPATKFETFVKTLEDDLRLKDYTKGNRQIIMDYAENYR